VCRIIDCDRQLARSVGEIMARRTRTKRSNAIVVAAAALVAGAVLTDDLADLRPPRGRCRSVVPLRDR
jgi:predicted nucleic acid-binding protein